MMFRPSCGLATALACLLAALPAALRAADEVEFARDVKPILHDRCVKCHAGTQKKGAFSINSRQSLLAGGESGAAVIPGKPAESELLRRVASDDATLRMPPEGKPLTDRQVATLRAWVEQGAAWEAGFAFAKEFRRATLAPRRPELPAATDPALSNPIDRLLQPYFVRYPLKAEPVSDRLFLRRVSLDLVGLLPSPERLEAFEKDAAADKREKAVEALLADNRNYADHWLTFWNDALRNAYRGTGFIDGGRKQITPWLYRALYENKPYDRFVHELISPVRGSGSEGFTWGIVWRGVVNESQRREIQSAQNVGQVFLGTNLKCASCHDSFVNHWKLAEAYALASVFADAPLEIHRCDKPTGEKSAIAFLYPELGTIDPAAPKAARMQRLADLMIDPRNGRFPRTIVNRLWAKLLGRGLVEMVDDMDAEPWSQDVLDFLAEDLVEHRYDLKRMLRLIATSRAYQLPAVGAPAQGQAGEYVFRGPWVKRMTAEQFVDGVRTLTGVWPEVAPDFVTVDGRGQGGQLLGVAEVLRGKDGPDPISLTAAKRVIDRFAEAKWLWSHAKGMAAAAGETTHVRKARKLDALPGKALALVTADNSVELFVNGKKLAAGADWQKPLLVDLTASLREGDNVFALKATNGGTGANPAGVIAAVAGFDAAGRMLWSDVTDATWPAAAQAAAGWSEVAFDASAWKPAAVIAGARDAPWGVAALAQGAAPAVASEIASLLGKSPLRAALLPLDALQSSLGRPNREQVVTIRETRASMLQALELANGTILDDLLKAGAARLQQESSDPAATIDRLYRTAFSRLPNAAERALATELIGSPPDAAGLADLLWTLLLSPEFQLVH